MTKPDEELGLKPVIGEKIIKQIEQRKKEIKEMENMNAQEIINLVDKELEEKYKVREETLKKVEDKIKKEDKK